MKGPTISGLLVLLLIGQSIVMGATASPLFPGIGSLRETEQDSRGLVANSGDWPPDGWQNGKIESLTLEELTLLLAGAHPGGDDHEVLKKELSRLDSLPAVYADVTRVSLEGMVQAMWHQEQAQRNLDQDQRRVLVDMKLDPHAPLSPQEEEVLALLDPKDIGRALEVLAATAKQVEALVQTHRIITEDGVVAALSKQAGIPERNPVLPSPTGPDIVTDLVAQIAAVPPDELPMLREKLEDAPGLGLGALEQILLALLPFAAGTPDDPEAALAELAAAVDGSREHLRMWAGAALANQAFPTLQLRFPNPDAPAPDLRPAWQPTSARQTPPPPLQETLETLADLFGDDSLREQAAPASRELAAALTQEEEKAVARVLDAIHGYITRHMESATVLALTDSEKRAVLAAKAALEDGGLLDPFSPEGRALAGAIPSLQAKRDQEASLQHVLASVEELISEFASPSTAQQSHDEDEIPCEEAVEEPIVVGFILAIDPCSRDNVWNDQKILIIDAGGDDTYSMRAGAPFAAATGTEIGSIGVPVSIVVDLGGNDTYDSQGDDCAQGAACVDHPAAGNDPTGVSMVRPLSVLVDWESESREVENRFNAGNRSQGFGGSGNTESGIGILMERIPPGSDAFSTYVAGKKSQGSNVDNTSNPTPQGGLGILVRLVGSDSQSDATFTAGPESQASGSVPSLSVDMPDYEAAMFLHVAGENVTTRTDYTAGTMSQGAIQNALAGDESHIVLFADVSGPGSQAGARYTILDDGQEEEQDPLRGRGYSESTLGSGLPNHPSAGAVFIDAIAPTRPSAEQSVQVPDPPQDLVDPSDPTQTPEPDQPEGKDEGGIVILPPEERRGANSNVFSHLDEGHGWGDGLFISLGGHDDYPNEPVEGKPRNNATWLQPETEHQGRQEVPQGDDDDIDTRLFTGIDADTLDHSGDRLPAFLSHAWNDFIGLWEVDPEDYDKSILAPQTVMVDLFGLDLHLDRPYSFVLTAGGHDIYGADFSATVHLDLGGDDLHLGAAGTAHGLLGGGVQAIFGDQDNPTDRPIRDRALSFHLNLAGDDNYASALPFNQGYGGDGAVGILFDLGGNDRFVAPHSAQGHADAGMGVLVALGTPGAAQGEQNTFESDSPSHGSAKNGGIGILAATAGHNRFNQGGELGENVSVANDGVGASVNLGDNVPPRVIRFALPEGDLQAGESYPFLVEVEDDDKDEEDLRLLEVCIEFEHSGGMDEKCGPAHEGLFETEYAWLEVHTDGRITDKKEKLPFHVNATVTDPTGGRGWNDTREDEPLMLKNPAPEIRMPRGPLEGNVNTRTAHQLPYQTWSDPEKALTESMNRFAVKNGTFPVDGVDWALEEWGSKVRVPDGSAIGTGVNIANAGRMIDGDSSTSSSLEFNVLQDLDSGTFFDGSPFEFEVMLPGARQISQVVFNASQTEQEQIHFKISGIRPDGSIKTISENVVIDGEGKEHRFSTALEEFTKIRVRQMVTSQDITPLPSEKFYGINVHAVQALGPGVIHDWRDAAPGPRSIEIRVQDEFGGRNGTDLPFNLLQPLENKPGTPGANEPVTLSNLGGRGKTHHASFTKDDDYHVKVKLNEDFPIREEYCLFWDNGEEATICLGPEDVTDEGGDHFLRFEGIRWAQQGEYPINITVLEDGSVLHERQLATAHVEEAFEINLGGEDPLVWIALTDDVRTWHVGNLEENSGHLVIVDAAGDNLYAGQIAVPRPPAVDSGDVTTPGAGGRPALLVSLGGDDTFLSTEFGTQGFGHHGAVALLWNTGGDDVYVAPGFAQGAGWRMGAGALVARAGHDAFNPLPHDHEDVLGGLPGNPDAWRDRPPALHGKRASLAPSQAWLVQGAAMEGFGFLILEDGHKTLQAGQFAQGYGRHELTRFDDYLVPNHPDQCPALLGGSPGELEVDLEGHLLCVLGVEWEDMGQDCGVIGIPEPCPPDLTRFNQWFSALPRYGPGTGVLLRLDGTATLDGGVGLQGASGSGGRGMALDLRGGLVASSDFQAQGYTKGGQAVFATMGEHGSWLGGLGHAYNESRGDDRPEPFAVEVAVYSGPGRDDTFCWSSEPCGETGDVLVGGPSSADVSGQGLDMGNQTASVILNIDTGPSAGGPGMEWGDGDVDLGGEVPSVWSGNTMNVVIDFDDLDSASLELVVVSQSRQKGPGGLCNGAPVGPPVLLHHEQEITQGSSVTFPVDLVEEMWDGRVLSAGCHRIRAFATSLDSVGPWSKLAGHVELLTPPRLVPSLVGADRVTAGQPVTIPFQVREPVAQSSPPGVKFRVMPEGAPCESSCYDPFESGGALDWKVNGTAMDGKVQWHPDAEEGGSGAEDGFYILEGRSSWPGTSVVSEWQHLGKIIVDREPPRFEVTHLPGYSRSSEGIHLEGTAFSFVGVADLRLHLIDGDGQTRRTIDADLMESPDGSQTLWSAQIDTMAHESGLFQIDVTATSKANAEINTRIGGLVLDNAPPRIDALLTPDGLRATNDPSDVRLIAHVGDLADRDCHDGCLPGAGVIPDSVVAFLRPVGAGMEGGVSLLERDPGLDACTPNGAECHPSAVGFRWNDPDAAAGPYEIVLELSDAVGNRMVHNPGVQFFVDVEPPEVELFSVQVPDGQSSVKEGDMVWVRAFVRDNLELDAVTAAWEGFGDGPVDLEAVRDLEESFVEFNGNLTVPAVDERTEIELVVSAVDLAGNRDSVLWRDPVTVLPPLPPLQVGVTERADTLLFSWTADRSLMIETLLLTDEDETVVENVMLEENDGVHQATFQGLRQDEEYLLNLTVRDAAGHVETVREVFRTLQGELEVDIELDEVPARSISGTRVFTGSISPAVDGTISLRLGGERGVLVDQRVVAPMSSPHPFDLEWDTREVLGSLSAAEPARLAFVFDDGLELFVKTIDVVVDNAPPEVVVVREGAEARNGWHNGSVNLVLDIRDDSLPVTSEMAVGDERFKPGKDVTLRNEGLNEVHFRVADSADPPNVKEGTVEVLIDRTAPKLSFDLGLDSPATANVSVPVSVDASDLLSGVDAFRYNTNGTWSPWRFEPPGNVTLDDQSDGQKWIEFQVRDVAGNVQGRAKSVVLDRVPPELLRVQWLGLDDAEKGRAIHVAFVDSMNGTGRPAGVDAVRFAPAADPDDWSAWENSTGNSIHVVPFTLLDPDKGVWVQARDRAGNLADAHKVPPPDAEYPDEPILRVPGDAEVPKLLRTSVTPDQAVVGSTFRFEAVVSGGPAPPDAVWLEFAGVRYPMSPTGTTLPEGGREYAVAVELFEPSSISQPSSYGILIQFDGGMIVEHSEGPVVMGADGAVASGQEKEAPFAQIGAIPLLILAIFVIRRRFA